MHIDELLVYKLFWFKNYETVLKNLLIYHHFFLNI